MIELNNITISVGVDRTLIKNLNLSINKGDRLAIIGEEGNGKSTLLKAIVDESQIEEYATMRGKIDRNGAKIGYLPQFLCNKWFDDTINDFFLKDNATDAEPNYENYMYYDKVSEYFSRFGMDFDTMCEQKMGSLSGGEKVKVQFIKLLVHEYDVLCLDEPTNDIDLETLELIEKFITESDLTFILISHDVEFLRKTATAVLMLEQLKRKSEFAYTFARIGYDEFIKRRTAKISKDCQVATAEVKNDRERQTKLNQIRKRVETDMINCPRGAPAVGANLKQKMKALMSMDRRFARERETFTQKPDPEEAITIKFQTPNEQRGELLNLNESIRIAGRDVKISLQLKSQDKIVIIGNNGVGKTTLLKVLMSKLRNKNVGYMPQDYDSYLNSFEYVSDFIDSVAKDKQEKAKIMTILGSMKFTNDEMQLKIGLLSGGQKAKIILAYLMSKPFDILILDEPTRNLSPLSSPELRNALDNYAGTVVAVSHDRAFISLFEKRYKLTSSELLLA